MGIWWVQFECLATPSNDFQQNCFVCGQSSIYDQCNPNRSDVIHDSSGESEIINCAIMVGIKRDDEWGFHIDCTVALTGYKLKLNFP